MFMKFARIYALYIMPACSVIGILLALLVLLSPSLVFRGGNSLITVSPPNGVDGPRVVMGAVGSCSKANNAATFNCTTSTVAPTYDLSVLPTNAPVFLINAPPAEAFGIVVLGLFISTIFTVMFVVISHRHSISPKLTKAMERPFWPNVTSILGVLGFFFGFTTFFILRIYLGKTVQDFNNTIAFQGGDAPKLIASIGKGFIVVWLAYGFSVLPIFSSLTKIHTYATKNI